ncbi:unnamed protein product, partial [marine sediment metagenome]
PAGRQAYHAPRRWRPGFLATVSVFISFLPNSDRHGQAFDVEPWETRALKLQAKLFRGATSYPSRGAYRKSDGTEEE